MDQDEAKRKESRTVVLVVLVVGVVLAGVTYFIPHDTMVIQIIQQVIRGW